MGVVVGVDPSISSTGLFILGESFERPLVAGGRRFRSKAQGEDLRSRTLRMRGLVDELALHLAQQRDQFNVDLFVVEGPAYGSPNQMGHMLAGFWWRLVDELHAHRDGAPVAVVQPSTLKKFATGDGSRRTDKKAMLAAAQKAFPAAGITGHDEADASALAAMGALWLGRDEGGVFARSGMGSVQAVRWPTLEKGPGQ